MTSRDTARDILDIPRERILVTVMGGSQGSAVLNDAVGGMLAALAALAAGDESVAVLHICGERFVSSPLPKIPNSLWYRRVGYESRMAEILASTDVLVCRGGAGTIAEIATVGVASVIIPWKDAAENHQRRNAEWLLNDGAAVVIDESELAHQDVAQAVAELVANSTRRDDIARRARALGEMNRQGALASAVTSVLAPSSRRSA
jgi:UDP-N-acetylglucosamine--N-acetylmuramyl-(pentapeptide) pyrophosphoryl-undecaprenol N-acetylglucosamine transferase